jgi:hypothetical protein
MIVDDRGAVEIMSRLAVFAEMLLENTEATSITRDGADPYDCFECTIYSRNYCYERRSAGGLIRLFAEPIDTHDDEQILVCELSTTDPHALSTLRTCLSAIEMVASLHGSKYTAGLHALQRLIDRALGTMHVVVPRRL